MQNFKDQLSILIIDMYDKVESSINFRIQKCIINLNPNQKW